MAAGRQRDNHEELRVKVEQAKREVLPAVELEKKEIKMVLQAPQLKVPSIVMTTVDDGSRPSSASTSPDADRIVGITASPQKNGFAPAPSGRQPEPTQVLKPEETSVRPRTPISPKLGKLTAEESSSIIEKTENLMEFFQDHEKQKDFVKRSTTKRPKKRRRTPSPSPVRQSIGLDHLDNLVRLMEQLSNLKDENVRLKSKCDYLESTKTLLQAKSTLDDDVLYIIHTNSLPRMKKKGKSHSTKSSKSDGGAVSFSRPRLPSAEDATLEFLDSASDQTPKRTYGKLYKRSFSTGSLEVPSDILEQSAEDDLSPRGLLENPFELKHLTKVSKSPEAKRKSKFSKWAKVKKVLTKQQLSENMRSGISSGLRSIKGLRRGAYMRYGTISGRELAVPNVAESRSVDSGVGSGMDGELQDVRKSTSSGEPPSPTRFIERHIDVPTPQVDDCLGIWLGPPEWIEKEREREQQLLKESKALSESPKSEPGDLGSPHSVSGFEEDSDKFLQVPIPRRQSSPLLADDYTEGEEYEEEHHLKRSASCKEPEVGVLKPEQEESKSEKKHKTPWGKMKNIIHTGSRKDSLKKKRKGRCSDSFGFEEVSEQDLEILDEIKYAHEGYLEGPVSRSTPKTSPVVFRQKHRDKSLSASPPSKGTEPPGRVTTVSGGTIDVSALLGGVSDEFTRKLQEWEELKGKRTSSQYKESSEFSESVSYDSAGPVSPEFQKKLDELEAERLSKEKLHTIYQEIESSSDEAEDVVHTPPEPQRQSVNLEEMQRKITDSFSRKMEEWERQKYRRGHGSVDSRDTPQKGSFKDRPKSKKTKEEKEREKLDKMREREMMRVEREEQKLEKERMRIEKEKLRALEREAKIEKMKGRLSQPDMESQLKNPILSPLQEHKVTADFARKLHEWEVRKGKDSTSTAMYLEAHKRSLQFATEYENAANMLSKTGETTGQETTDTDEAQMRKTSSESDELLLIYEPEKKPGPQRKVKGQKPPPLTLIPCFDSPEVSPGAPYSDESSLDDQSTETMESMTQANIQSLEKANRMLLEQLRQKEIEYCALQEDVRELNDQVIVFREEHAMELDQYKKQLVEGFPSGEMALDTKNMSTTLSHLENKIVELQKFGEQLAMSMEGAALATSMEGAAIGKFQTVEGEESINNRLVDLLDKMRVLLQQANFSGEKLVDNTLEEVSKKSSALRNFEKLYSQAMHLQVQMNNLRLSQLERNKEIMTMKRHLLVQEANNLLLQADVTRREAELLHYREYAQRRVPIKRWNTYSGKEDRKSDFSPKETVFQRVQRLRSARIISSTTDSDSDAPTKSPQMSHRESPRVRKRESPKSRRKESPKTRKKESPLSRRRETPQSRIKQSPGIARHAILEVPFYERETDRREEHVRTSSIKIVPEGKHDAGRGLHFSTVALPTAKLTLPKDISPHEMIGVPRSSKDKKGTALKAQQDISSDKAKIKEDKDQGIQTAKGLEPKFPELLIPEWKKKPSRGKRSSLQRMPSIERDEVFESDTEVVVQSSAQALSSEKEIGTGRSKVEEGFRLLGDISFDSSETSEDTLKYLSPEASPAPRLEPPNFPSELRVMRRPPLDGETASDPGASRPTSLIKVSVASTTPTLLRKPPFGRIQSRRLNIPVIPLRRIKPAQELLEDSQRYRSGHSIYLTRILKRYPMKLECRSRTIEQKQADDKENIKEGHVKSIVEKMSREGTPESPKLTTQGSLEEVPKSKFVHQIVRKMSTPGPILDKDASPLKDLTNDGQVKALKQAFTNGTTESENKLVSVLKKSQGSQDHSYSQASSSSSSTMTFSQLSTKTESGKGSKNGSSISSNLIYSSMPMLSLEGDDTMRERSATTSRTSGNTTPTTQGPSFSAKDSPLPKHKIHVAVSLSPGRSRRVIDPNMSPARLRRLMDPASPGRRRRFRETTPIELVVEEPCESSISVAQSQTSPSSFTLQSPKLKKDKPKKGTIGALCRGSMTFDLGVSIHSSEGTSEQGAGAGAEISPVRHSTSSTTSTSSMSEIEGATGGTPKERKKSRHKFMDSAFIQKSRKFFKVSKENRCPSLECCGSDRESLLD